LGEELAPLPQPRTSHDLTNVIYQVVAGKEEAGPKGPPPSQLLLTDKLHIVKSGKVGKGEPARRALSLPDLSLFNNVISLWLGKEASPKGGRFLPKPQ